MGNGFDLSDPLPVEKLIVHPIGDLGQLAADLPRVLVVEEHLVRLNNK